MLLMLAALRRLPELDRATREGTGWPSDPSLGETVRDIGGCTVGLVGYGNIAKRVETIVAAMGADVLHTSTRDDGHPGWRPLPDLLAASDIVSLHLPLTEQTARPARPRRAGADEAGCGAGEHLPRTDRRRGRAGRRAARRRGWPPRAWTSSPSNRCPPTTRC